MENQNSELEVRIMGGVVNTKSLSDADNVFYITLEQDVDGMKRKVFETGFDGDQYNPVTRYSVDIRRSLSSIIYQLQTVLSNSEPNCSYMDYSFVDEYIKSFDIQESIGSGAVTSYLLEQLKETTFITSDQKRKYTGVKFFVKLSNNNNTIVERTFLVKRYNPESLFSLDLADVFNNIKEDIVTIIKNADVKHMWEDNELMSTYGMNMGSIRELTTGKRRDLVSRL